MSPLHQVRFLPILAISVSVVSNAFGQNFMVHIPRVEPLSMSQIRSILNDQDLQVLCPDGGTTHLCTVEERPHSSSAIMKIGGANVTVPNTLGKALIERGFRDTLAYLEDVGTRMRMFLGVSGDLKGAIDKGSGTSAATGALQLLVQDGWSRNNKWGHAISGQVSIAAVDDTVTSLYASSLLAPRTGRLSSQLTGVVYRRIRWNYSVYAKGYTYLSTTTWSRAPSDSLDGQMDSVTRDGNIVGGGLLLGGQVFKVQDAQRRNEAASIAVELGLAFRRLGGALIENDPTIADQGSSDATSQPFFQSQFGFPTDDNVYVGFELGVLAFYKGFTLGVTFYHFGPDEQIPGFTGGQMAGGVSIGIDLVEL